MGELLALLQTVWALVMQAPWAFVALAFALLAVGWAAGRFMFGERIETLKERLEAYKEKLGGSTPDEVRTIVMALKERMDDLADPRLFETSRLDTIKSRLGGVTGEIMITRDVSSAETARVQVQTVRFFRQIGWKVTSQATMSTVNPPACGLILWSRSDKQPLLEGEWLVMALRSAAIEFELREEPSSKNLPPLQLHFTDRW